MSSVKKASSDHSPEESRSRQEGTGQGRGRDRDRPHAPRPPVACVHRLFEAQARRHPDAPAVGFRGASLSYRDLNARANQLAHHLRRLGVGTETLVGICTRRSPEMVVAILGVLKAGGAYLPLDPDYPPERLAFMIEDSRARVLLTQEGLLDRLPDRASGTLCLDRNWPAIARERRDDPAGGATLDNLAYVIYTSGSTGRPKGVLVVHRGLTNYLAWAARAYAVARGTGAPVHSSFSFDLTITGLYAPLLVGRRVDLIEDGDGVEPLAAALRAANDYSLVKITPAHLQLLAQQIPAAEAAGRTRAFIIGGEQLTSELVAFWQQHAPDTLLINEYGPTETVVGCCVYRVPNTDRRPGALPIGKAIANTRLYVLDDAFEPAPIGVAGELYIGGAGVARGYHDRPALTAAAFVPDPFSSRPGARLYRTGDRARWRPDGNLEFLGRLDDQVKIRGHRVELGEVETALARHPAVRDAVAMVREDRPGDHRLTAYLRLAPGAPDLDPETLRRFLRETLPESMVPSAFVTLDAIPLTANGKVDRKALPAPDASHLPLATEFVPPRNPAEERVAHAWAAVLGLPRVGVLDNFFDLGGHSLLATQLASRLRDAFQRDVPLRWIFESPTVAGLAHRLSAQADAEVHVEPIAPAPPNVEPTLSFAQERLWFLDQLEPGSPLYNIPIALELNGDLQLQPLRLALLDLIKRHRSLQAAFPEQHGNATLRFHEPPDFHIPLDDLQDEPAERRLPLALDRARAEAALPFDLHHAPLLRLRLLRIEPQLHIAVLTLHHIIADGWSLTTLVRELADAYRQRLARPQLPPDLPTLPIQYHDYAHWQRSFLRGTTLDRQLDYWENRLKGLPAALELPTDRPRPHLPSYRGQRTPVAIGPDLAHALAALARRHNATPFMVLLPAFQALLARLSGQQHVAVGTPIAGRQRRELEGLIGLFVNTLVLAEEFDDDPSFDQLVDRARKSTLDAYAHQDLPFERLVERLQPERDMGRTPLFQAMFALQNAPAAALDVPGLSLRPLELDSGTAKFDLTLALAENPDGGYSGSLETNSDLFDPDTAGRFAARFLTLLHAAVENPELRASELPILIPGERRRLLVDWNPAPADLPSLPPVHHQFEAQAARDPAALALSFEGEQVTYGDLNARANRLAHHLRRLGVGPEVLVGLCVERSVEMVVGILGILKAGGAYVPLDTAHPPDRLAYLLEDCRASLVLTVESLRHALEAPGIRAILLDADRDEIAGESPLDPAHDSTLAHTCYVIYTSGSTGKPKGVPVTHANVARLFTATDHWFAFGPSDVWTLFHSFAFDFSVWEIWGALIHGGRLVIVPYWVSRSPEAFDALLRDEQVTVLNQTPSAFRQLVGANLATDAGIDPALRLVIFGGEALELQALRPWFDRHGDRTPQLVNMYGITETTVHVTYRPVTLADLDDGSGRSPIGVAIPDLRVYVLDANGEPAPIGVAGELHVGGEGVARGYLNRPGLTAERFVPDPFGDRPGARLYRSGDRARWRPDGQLDYHGRGDRQVKIRGHRIEPGEIEAALAAHPDLREAVVLDREDRPGDRRLVAYLVPAPGRDAPGSTDLRPFLKASLPDYMIPSAFVTLDAMPLTPNGKLDRDALPAPVSNRNGQGPGSEFVPPRNPAEERVAHAWAAVLGLPRVGVLDNFFDLGGHSLLATQLASRLRDAFQRDVPLRWIFESPTVAGLAHRLSAQADAEVHVEPIAPAPPNVEPTLSFAQERLWFLDQLEPGSPLYNIPIALELNGDLQLQPLRLALRDLIKRHRSLQAAFPEQHGNATLRFHEPPDFHIPLDDLQDEPAERRLPLALDRARAEAALPFDLHHAPLLRLRLLRIEPQLHIAVLTLHHIIADGWSLTTLVRELADAYRQRLARPQLPPDLPTLPIQYHDYAHWQRSFLRGTTLDRQLDYWENRLKGLPAALELPTDRPRPHLPSYRGQRTPVAIGPDLAHALAALARRHNATPFMVLLPAFQALLARLSGQQHVAVGTPIAGRQRRELEGLIGLFVNTLVLAEEFDDDPSFDQLVDRARKSTLDAYAHQDLPFERLVERLQPERDMGRTPLFQAMFALQNAPAAALDVPGLSLRPLELDSGTAKFDLTLALAENPDGGYSGSLETNSDLFDADTAGRFAARFLTLLHAAVENPELRASELPILNGDERHLLAGWNANEAPLPDSPFVHQMIEAQAARTPDAIALRFGDVRLTYRELDERSQRLASLLQQRGARPDTTVAVLLDRSEDLIVALLAVLKAGAAYIPLDPLYPPDRIAFMIRDANPTILLTQDRYRELLPLDDGDATLLSIDDEPIQALLDGNGNGNRDDDDEELPRLLNTHQVAPANLAYTIYTSGSTGKPKGVQIPHAALANFLLSLANILDLKPSDRLLAVTTLSFDIAALECFLPLTRGATILLASRDEAADGNRLIRRIQRDHPTLLQATPATWRLLLEAGWDGLPDLRILCGGEALPRELADRLLTRGHALWNLYGPTETTIWSTASRVEPGDGVVPIGKPIANTRVYVLDSQLRPTPLGVVGELYIGGLGLARGYHARPGLTAERFLPDPVGDEPGARVYRTGDLARWRADGRLECLGRVDHQVKIRGFRIELGEVEEALLAHDGVREAVAVALEDGTGESRLAAYLVADGTPAPSAKSLRRALKERLPQYMVPSTFTVLDALPLTPSGKIDRKALPAPGDLDHATRDAAPPRDDLEARLVAIWEDVLGTRPVGIDETFFDLGGHSLLAIRLMSRIEETFGRKLPLTSLFVGSTIEDLATLLRAPVEEAPWSPLVAIQGAGTLPPFFCVHPAGGIVYCFHELARQLGPDRPFYAFQSAGLDDDQEPYARMEDMAARYVEALRAVQPEGPYHLGGWSLGGLIAFEMARQLVDAGQEVATLALFDTRAPAATSWRDAVAPDAEESLKALARDVAALALHDDLPRGPVAEEDLLDDAAILAEIAADMVVGFEGDARLLVKHLKGLPPQAQRDYVLNHFGLDQVYHLETGPDRVRRLWVVLRANLMMGSRYRAKPYPGRLILFRATAWDAEGYNNPTMGWERLVEGGVTTHVVPGDHTTILKPPAVSILAAALRSELAATNGGPR